MVEENTVNMMGMSPAVVSIRSVVASRPPPAGIVMVAGEEG